MEKVRAPKYQVVYSGKDITEDLLGHVLQITYSDKTDGQSDEISIVVDDTFGLWRNKWIPDKGDTLDVKIGYDGYLFPCGIFQIDDIELSGPPDTVSIRGLAVRITDRVRTKRSYSHQNKTLSQIAQRVAQLNGLILFGAEIVRDIKIEKRSQNRQTDLEFLKDLAAEFGYVFSIRDTRLTFTSIYDLEAADSITEISRADLIRYRLKDTAHKIYRSAEVKYHNPENGELVKAEWDNETPFETTANILTVYDKAENVQQAEEKARAALHRANTRSQTGSITISGNTAILAGINIELVKMGRLSGVYHVTGSNHSISPSAGYITTAEIKKIGLIDQNRW